MSNGDADDSKNKNDEKNILKTYECFSIHPGC